MKTILIGAGVAGLLYASMAEDLLILEKNEFAGRKLLATGNGRCNFTNLNLAGDFYHSSNRNFYKSAIKKYDNYDFIAYLNNLGVLTNHFESGRCYPQSLSSKTIRDSLFLKASEKNTFIFNEEVVAIDFNKNVLRTKTKTYSFDKLIVATGGMSLEGSGSDGKILKILGKYHKLTDISFAITNYKAKNPLSKLAKGTRVKAGASLFVDGSLVKESYDDVIFQTYGLTGTAIFDLSNDISYALLAGKDIKIKIDLLKEYESTKLIEILDKLVKAYPKREAYDLLKGFISDRLIKDILKRSVVEPKKWAMKLRERDLERIVSTLKGLIFDIDDIYDRQNAQVTIGGIDTKYVDEVSFESKIIKNLYFIGEILDVDGACGGYNIQWAYSSAKSCLENMGDK